MRWPVKFANQAGVRALERLSGVAAEFELVAEVCIAMEIQWRAEKSP